MVRITGTGNRSTFFLPARLPSLVLRRGTGLGPKYWEEQGWKVRGDVMEGYYRTHYGSFQGRIDIFSSGDHRYYIRHPPPELRLHSHWACFSERENGFYHVHFAIKAQNVDTGILTIERILCEALERYTVAQERGLERYAYHNDSSGRRW